MPPPLEEGDLLGTEGGYCHLVRQELFGFLAQAAEESNPLVWNQ